MNLEHFAINVPDAPALAKWYVENLGMRIVQESASAPFIHFLADESGSMIEIYSNPNGTMPDYASMDPFALHIAFTPDDIEAKIAELLEAGATKEGELNDKMFAGVKLQFMRDPWGICLQLVHRDKALI